MFRRRQSAPRTPRGAHGAPLPASPPVTVIAPRGPAVVGRPELAGGTGWRPGFVAASPQAQIGVYAGTMLTQYPANLPGVQLFCGVEGLRSNRYVPATSATSAPPEQRAQAFANVQAAQRFGQSRNAPLGLLSSRKMRSNVTAQQVRQSGVQAMQWAQNLSASAASALRTNYT